MMSDKKLSELFEKLSESFSYGPMGNGSIMNAATSSLLMKKLSEHFMDSDDIDSPLEIVEQLLSTGSPVGMAGVSRMFDESGTDNEEVKSIIENGPASYTAAEVLDILPSLDKEVVAQVLFEEKSTKNRVTVIAACEEILEGS